jgi:hypothetical protein
MANRKLGYTGLRKSKSLIPIFLVFFTLTSCVRLPDPETTQDFNKDIVASLRSGQTIGQTFVNRRSHFNGVDLWVGIEKDSELIKVELFHSIGDEEPLYEKLLSIRSGKNRIEIQPRDDPPNQPYYLRLSSPNGEIDILGRNEDIYSKGSATIKDQPIHADIAFRATYEYNISSIFEDLKVLLSRAHLIVLLFILLILPGELLLDISQLKDKFDWGERLALSIGLSLCIIPLLMLWTSLLYLRWGPISVWLFSGGLVATKTWRWYRKRANTPGHRKYEPAPPTSDEPSNQQSPFLIYHAQALILFLIFILSLFIRFAMVRDLAAPPWVDSIHHSLITRLIMEGGGIFDSYSPYLPPEADYYHFGFHSMFSFFIWLTGLKIPEGMLFFGQVLNALIVFAVYLLAKTLTKNNIASLTAGLVAGVFTLMPAYYTSWGRYTHLTGLLVLPVGFRLFSEISKQRNLTNRRTIMIFAFGGISFAGLFLIHYRVAAFLGAFVLAYIIAQINPNRWFPTIQKTILMVLISLIFLLPWLPGTISRLILPKGNNWTGGGVSSLSQIPWNFLKPGLGTAALILAGFGLLIAIFLIKRFALTVLLWTAFMYLLANLSILDLPGSGFINPLSMEITLFIPIAVLSGYAVGGMIRILDKITPNPWHTAIRYLLLIIGTGSAILGAQRLLPTLNPITFLAREADFPAIEWIGQNVAEKETILINPTGWGYGLYMGHDGGYWIAPLSGHMTIPPPVLYGLGDRNEIDQINQQIEYILGIGEDARSIWDLMHSRDIRFIYIGGRGGILSPQSLESSGLFSLRYHQGGTWLFEILDEQPKPAEN